MQRKLNSDSRKREDSWKLCGWKMYKSLHYRWGKQNGQSSQRQGRASCVYLANSRSLLHESSGPPLSTFSRLSRQKGNQLYLNCDLQPSPGWIPVIAWVWLIIFLFYLLNKSVPGEKFIPVSLMFSGCTWSRVWQGGTVQSVSVL